MDQSKSSEQKKVQLPKRSLSVEFFVGIFTLLGVLAVGYLSVHLGGLSLYSSNYYEILADFDNISGLQPGASVEIAGVPVGEVSRIYLTDPTAKVVLKIVKSVRIRDDDIASIRTKGIIGDRYVKISRGASDVYLKEGDVMSETESVVDIEDIIGKIVHNLGGEKDDE